MASDVPLGQTIESMFEDFLAPFVPYSSLSRRQGDGTASPHLKVVETEKAFAVEAELPGVTKDDIKVSIDNRRVSIEAESKRESERKEGENVIYSERSSRRFARSFTLPTEVDDAGAQAQFENGILILNLPKKESAHARILEVK
jgi:HSP20 family protein